MPRRRRPGVLPSMSHTGIFIVRHHLHSSDIRGLCFIECSQKNASKFSLLLEQKPMLLISTQYFFPNECPVYGILSEENFKNVA